MSDIFPERYVMDQQDLKVFIPVVAGLIGFLVFWFSQQSESLKQKFKNRYPEEKAEANFILYTRYLGGISMGIIPAMLYFIFISGSSLNELGVVLENDAILPVILWSLAIVAVIVPLVYSNAKKPKNLLLYPQIRTENWNRKLVWSNFFSWGVYLLGYEILFRGVLLFPLVTVIGIWPAVAVNIGLYSATHIPKGLTETIGAIPLSILLCLLCINIGNLWPAFLIHIAIAWTNTWISLRHNPSMRITRRTSP